MDAENDDDWTSSVKGDGVAAASFERAFQLENLFCTKTQPTHLVDSTGGWVLESSREPAGVRWHLYDSGSRETLVQFCDLRPAENRIVMLEYTPKVSLDRVERVEAFRDLGVQLQTFAALKG